MKNLVILSKEIPHKKFLAVKNKLDEGLNIIKKYEKLSPREGEIRITYPSTWPFSGNMCVEIYAPHLIPNSLSCVWEAPEIEEALDNCLKDLNSWIEIEKDAPRDKFWLDL